MKARILFALIAVLIAFEFGAFGHGDLHDQIDALTRQIAKNKTNPDLYIRRGELHRIHQDWDKALADYYEAEKIDANLAAINFLKGRLLFEKGELPKAKEFLDKFLASSTTSPEPYLVRAKIFRDLKKFHEAHEDFSKAIALFKPPQPEHYIERARVALAATPSNPQLAINGLEEGLKRLGAIITLQLEAVDIETRAGLYDSALQRLEKIIQRSPRKEKWLVQKGDLLLLAGKPEEGRKAYEGALAAIDNLPAQHRNTKAMADLRQRAEKNLAKK